MAAASNVPVDTATKPGGGASYGITPAQLRAMVSAEVAAQIGPQRAGLTQAQHQADAGYGAQQRSVEAITNSYRDALAGIAPQVHDAYDSAGNATAAYGKGFSDVLQHVLGSANDSAQSLLGVAGAPAAQGADVAAKGTAPTDALYAVHGVNPADDFQREGAAFTTQAAELPAQAVERGLIASQGISGAQNKTDQAYQDRLSALLASIPTLRTNATNNVLRNARADEATALMEQRYGLSVANTTGYLPNGQPTAATTRHHDAAVAKQQAARQAAVGRRDKSTASLLTKLGTWVDKQRHLSGAVVVGHQPKMRSTKDAAGLTQTEYLTPHGWVVATAPPKDTIQTPIYDQHHSLPFPYQRAKAYVTQQLTAGLSAYGYKPADIQQMVLDLIGPDPGIAAFDAGAKKGNVSRTHAPGH